MISNIHSLLQLVDQVYQKGPLPFSFMIAFKTANYQLLSMADELSSSRYLVSLLAKRFMTRFSKPRSIASIAECFRIMVSFLSLATDKLTSETSYDLIFFPADSQCLYRRTLNRIKFFFQFWGKYFSSQRFRFFCGFSFRPSSCWKSEQLVTLLKDGLESYDKLNGNNIGYCG